MAVFLALSTGRHPVLARRPYAGRVPHRSADDIAQGYWELHTKPEKVEHVIST
ncbi:hypothetical protein [Streptomyces chiangmaiensis]|uniref:Uncharacterized protein n=1 Tax=Streptomyces chiangmaiensis TaxID=766497 RepID=A0ABU7FR11_9ACTN|nr:hypothetical protein [Streptomyces chiangmaiensis]MED7826268.1 hypothetical protein [Streptomyces chiangmaiensis]